MTGFNVQGTALFSRHTPGGAFTIADVQQVPGALYFVDSNHANKGDTVGHGKSPDLPFATLDYAIGIATANQGDVILVAPKHAETHIAAGAVALDKAGITVLGLGRGAQRPTFTFATDNAASWTVGAADITIRNLLLANDKDGQTVMLDINAAPDFTAEDIELREGSAKQPVTYIDINGGGANVCDRVTLRRVKIVSRTAGATQGVELGAVQDGVIVEDCMLDGDFTAAAIHNPVGNIMTNLQLNRNIVRNRNSGNHAVELVSACTGHAVDNRLFGDTLGTILDPGSLFCAGNLESSAIDVPAVQSPVAVVDAASNFLGVDDADNAAATTNVVANKDGSVLERLEQIMEAINPDSGTSLAATESLADVLYAANGIVTFPAAALPANGVSIAEALRYVADKQGWRPLMGNWDFATDTGVAGAFTVFTVTGVVEVQVFAVCNTNPITAGGAVTLELGVAGNTAGLIAQITDARDLIANEVWVDATPTTTLEAFDHYAKNFVITNGQDIIQTIGVGGLTAGTIDYYLFWRPLSADGAVVAA